VQHSQMSNYLDPSNAKSKGITEAEQDDILFEKYYFPNEGKGLLPTKIRTLVDEAFMNMKSLGVSSSAVLRLESKLNAAANQIEQNIRTELSVLDVQPTDPIDLRKGYSRARSDVTLWALNNPKEAEKPGAVREKVQLFKDVETNKIIVQGLDFTTGGQNWFPKYSASDLQELGKLMQNGNVSAAAEFGGTTPHVFIENFYATSLQRLKEDAGLPKSVTLLVYKTDAGEIVPTRKANWGTVEGIDRINQAPLAEMWSPDQKTVYQEWMDDKGAIRWYSLSAANYKAEKFGWTRVKK
jgi:hypothetical protein